MFESVSHPFNFFRGSKYVAEIFAIQLSRYSGSKAGVRYFRDLFYSGDLISQTLFVVMVQERNEWGKQ